MSIGVGNECRPAIAGDRIASFCRALETAFGDEALAVAEAQLAAAGDEGRAVWRAIVDALSAADRPE